MSWSVSVSGPAAEVLMKLRAELGASTRVEPEDTVRKAVLNLFETTFPHQEDGRMVYSVSAYGHQSVSTVNVIKRPGLPDEPVTRATNQFSVSLSVSLKPEFQNPAPVAKSSEKVQ